MQQRANFGLLGIACLALALIEPILQVLEFFALTNRAVFNAKRFLQIGKEGDLRMVGSPHYFSSGSKQTLGVRREGQSRVRRLEHKPIPSSTFEPTSPTKLNQPLHSPDPPHSFSERSSHKTNMARPGYFVSVQWDLQNDIRLDSGKKTMCFTVLFTFAT